MPCAYLQDNLIHVHQLSSVAGPPRPSSGLEGPIFMRVRGYSKPAPEVRLEEAGSARIRRKGPERLVSQPPNLPNLKPSPEPRARPHPHTRLGSIELGGWECAIIMDFFPNLPNLPRTAQDSIRSAPSSLFPCGRHDGSAGGRAQSFRCSLQGPSRAWSSHLEGQPLSP